MDDTFSLVLPSTTKITLNERFSNLESTCQEVDDDLRSVRFASFAAERFEASKNQRLALQLANRMCLKDDSSVTLDNVPDDSFAEVAMCSFWKNVAQHLSHVPGQLTEVRPSAKLRLSQPAAAVAAGLPVRPGFANILPASTVDGAVAGLKKRKRPKSRKKRSVSTPLESSRVISTLDTGQEHLHANRADISALSTPANGLITNSHIQTAVANRKTGPGRLKRRKARGPAVGAPQAQCAQTKALAVGAPPAQSTQAKALAVGAPPAQSTQPKRSGKQKTSSGPQQGGVCRALSSTARPGPRKSRGAVKVAAPDTATLDRELDDYMSHAKRALA